MTRPYADLIAQLTEERDQALAQAAAVAMDMRKQAVMIGYATCAETRHITLGDEVADGIKALPIDPDSQKALDKMLTEAEQRGYANAMKAERKDADQRISKARGEAIREVLERLRHEDDVNPSQTYDDAIEWVEYILSLLTDGGQP